jgi:uncharacterized protein YecT (DUF1311 family)
MSKPSNTQTLTFTVTIDFDKASAAWKADTLADNPAALRRKQKAYWKDVRDKDCVTRRSSRKRKAPERLITDGLRKSRRKRRSPDRLIHSL